MMRFSAFITIFIILSGCAQSMLSDSSEELLTHQLASSQEPVFLLNPPSGELPKIFVSIEAPNGHIWESDESSLTKRRIRLTGHRKKYPFFQPHHWFYGEGTYLIQIKVNQAILSLERHISGDEVFIELFSRYQEEEKSIELYIFKRTFRSSENVHISNLTYDKEEDDRGGDLSFLLTNDSDVDIHGEVFEQLRGVIQYPVKGQWVDFHTEGVCGTGEMPESLPAGFYAHVGEPAYFGYTNLPTGSYRLVVEYSHTSSNWYGEPQSRTNMNAYRLTKYFTIDEQGVLHTQE